MNARRVKEDINPTFAPESNVIYGTFGAAQERIMIRSHLSCSQLTPSVLGSEPLSKRRNPGVSMSRRAGLPSGTTVAGFVNDHARDQSAHGTRSRLSMSQPCLGSPFVLDPLARDRSRDRKPTPHHTPHHTHIDNTPPSLSHPFLAGRAGRGRERLPAHTLMLVPKRSALPFWQKPDSHKDTLSIAHN